MAKAPRPGARGAAKGSSRVIEITVRGEPVRLALGMLGPRDDALVRREALKALGYKISLQGVLGEVNDADAIGMDTITLLWWLARRKAGASGLSLDDALEEFPSYGEFEGDPKVVAARTIEPGEDDQDGQGDGSPEASGGPSAADGPR